MDVVVLCIMDLQQLVSKRGCGSFWADLLSGVVCDAGKQAVFAWDTPRMQITVMIQDASPWGRHYQGHLH